VGAAQVEERGQKRQEKEIQMREYRASGMVPKREAKEFVCVFRCCWSIQSFRSDTKPIEQQSYRARAGAALTERAVRAQGRRGSRPSQAAVGEPPPAPERAVDDRPRQW
jgi:hypothetical protein